MKFRNLMMGALALVGTAGALTTTEAEAASGNGKVICNPTSGCGPGAGSRGGAATGISDATVWAPVQVYEDTTIINNQLSRDGHALIPEISIKGRTDLAAYDGRVMTIAVQGIPQGARGTNRIQVRFDATPEGDEIEIAAPRGFENAGIAGLNGTQNGKILRIAFRACDYGKWLQPQPETAHFDLQVPDGDLPSYTTGERGIDIPGVDTVKETGIKIDTVTSTGQTGSFTNNPAAPIVVPFVSVTPTGASFITDDREETTTTLRLVGVAPPPPAPVPVQMTPPPPPAPVPVQMIEPPAERPIAPPRIVGNDNSVLQLEPGFEGFQGEIRADGGLGNLTNGSAAATGIFRSGDFWLRGGLTGAYVDGSPLGVQVETITIDPAYPVLTYGTEIQGQVKPGVVDPMITAMAAFDVFGKPENVQQGGGYLRVQAGIDGLQGAGQSADDALLLAGDPVDPLTRAVFAAGAEANVGSAGIEASYGFGDTGALSITARAAVTKPLFGDKTIGLSDDFAMRDEAFGTGAHQWNYGLHGSAEARWQLSDSFTVRAGGSYDQFNFDDRYAADICGNCGFSYELISKGKQTNITGSLGADYTGERFQASVTGNYSSLTNIGNQTITGQVIEGNTAYLGEDLVGFDAKGVYGTAKARYDFGDIGGFSAVVRGDYGNWDLNRYGTERTAQAFSVSAGPRYDSDNGRFFVEGRVGYESVDRPDGNKSGPTARVGIGFKF